MAGPAAVDNSAVGYAHLLDPNRKWYNNWRIIALNGWIVLFLITSSTNGFDGSMMNGLQSLSQWQDAFNHPSNGLLGLLNAIQNIGSLAAYPFAPYASDYMGRRPTVFLGACIMVGATAIQTASQSVNMFIGARFLIGFGLSFAANSAPMLVSEISYPPYRASLTSLYNSLWYSGSIIAAWTTFGSFKIPNSWAWRTPSLLQGLPAVLQVCLVWFAPESPRWLMSKGREAQALHTLAYYHADGNESDPLVQYEFEEIKAALEFDRTVAANVGWKSFITSPGNRKRLRIIVAIAFFSQWSGNGLVSYYLNKVFDAIGITDPTTQLLINGILQIWNLAVAVTASFLAERLGRRVLFMTSCIGMVVFWTGQTICFKLSNDGNTAAAHGTIVFIFLFYMAYEYVAFIFLHRKQRLTESQSIAFTPLIVSYTVEILPYHLRAKGFNIFNFTISLALIFNQYVNPIALGKLSWRYYIVYACWLLFETAFCYVYIIETKGRTLEETAALFDGVNAAEFVSGPVVHGEKESTEGSEKAESGIHVERLA
ncbi:hexose transporter [Fomitiporia mediterranea MF3/22]|uniref:hexose transporter n=1 Tax=Fomitiporia mediterranea (strain MF3/22) TaxID=694068 RepID=UPI00044081FA|nr:hexose transporter [Fomitiporia mediterranea MF3/22]EJC98278.1 hexose transporter [Fomitiporia mediterranea MF3/22]